jgi:predicted nucleic-acid-binding protein
MIALDTNILARLLLRDDGDQYQRAVSLLGDGRAYTAPPTVLLELVWVLGNNGSIGVASPGASRPY